MEKRAPNHRLCVALRRLIEDRNKVQRQLANARDDTHRAARCVEAMRAEMREMMTLMQLEVRSLLEAVLGVQRRLDGGLG